MMNPYLVFVGIVLICAVLWVVSRYFSLWLQATVSGAHIGFINLALMPLRKVNPKMIVRCKVMAAQSGLDHISTRELEAQYLAGGNILRITLALIAAQKAGIELDWNTAAAIDLAGRNILEAVQVSVNPKVISCPDPESGYGNTLDGVAKDGIQLQVKVRVTVRTNLKQLIGGATEATVIARVGQSIVTAIGSCENYQNALTDPQVITRKVIEKKLDSQTAFTIVSIDIADISVGKNIGAALQIDQANTDIRVAQADAEKRRAMAVSVEQEMKSLTQQYRANVVLAEAKIPLGVADAYRKGNIKTRKGKRRPLIHEVAAVYPKIARPRS